MSHATRATLEQARQAAVHFPLHGRLTNISHYGSGHINDTFLVCHDQAGTAVRYILQRVNHRVFKDVPRLMENIQRVSSHAAQTPDCRADSRRALTLVPTAGGHPFHRSESGDFWRVYLFIEGARTFDQLESPRQAFEAAKAFGTFQRLLADLPGAPLHETIPAFHDTRRRFETLRQAAAADVAGRKAEVAAELAFAFEREADTDRLLALGRNGDLPTRVTHNDTKINNVMLDEQSGEGICVIDLDTVMPGFSLYDFGDMVRSATITAAEDERDLSKVGFRQSVFESLANGFAAGAGAVLNDAEWENLAFAGRIMTYEVGIRFLTDYLQGDVYFRTHRPGQNLDRCRTQFRLVECLEAADADLKRVVAEVRRSVG